MRNEIAAAPTRAILPQGYTFATVETEVEVAETIQQLHAAGNVPIALVIIRLFYKAGEKSGQAGQGTVYLLQNIRPLTRKTDHVFLCQHSMYFVLPAANLQGAQIVEERLWQALLWRVHSMSEQEALRPERLAIGHSAFPDPYATPEELLRAARETSKHFGERVSRAGRRNSARNAYEEEAGRQEEKEELPLLAKKLGIPYLTLLPRKLPRRVVQVVNARLAQELHCYPVGRERNILTVAMLNPQDHKALERLHQETGLRIFPVLTHPEALETALKQLL